MPPKTAAQRLRDAVRGDNLVEDLADHDTTQPLETRTDGPALVKAGRNHRDIAFGDLIEIVRHAERQVFDGQIAVRIQAELDNARRQMQRREHVDVEIIRAIHGHVVGWLHQATPDEDGAS